MIRSEMIAILTGVGDGRKLQTPVHTELSCSEDDPIAVTMTFKQPSGEEAARWRVSRELVEAAMEVRKPVGEGDIRLQRYAFGDCLIVCLRCPEGHADLRLPLKSVAEFLELSQVEVTLGADKIPAQVDALIEELLG